MKNTKNFIILILALFATVVILTALFVKEDSPINAFKKKDYVSIYFLRTYGGNNIKLSSVTRKIETEESPINFAVEELLLGPNTSESELGYFSEIPKNTELIDLQETDERVIINLSKEFDIGGGSSSMIARLQQLIYTALDNVDKKPVYLQIEGEQVEYLGGEGVSVPQPLSRNIHKGQEI